jgi:hypothetical protein
MFPWCLQELEAQRSISPCSPSRGSWRFGGDGDADNTVKAYQNAVRSLADWLAEDHPEMGPVELDRQHIRGWLVEVRERHSSNTARGWFAGVRHGRRRRPAGPDRVRGWQGQPAEWPRHRVVSLGVKAARALDRYLPERRRHPYVDTLRLWLGSRGRPTIDADGVKAMLKRRGADEGAGAVRPLVAPAVVYLDAQPPPGASLDLLDPGLDLRRALLVVGQVSITGGLVLVPPALSASELNRPRRPGQPRRRPAGVNARARVRDGRRCIGASPDLRPRC